MCDTEEQEAACSNAPPGIFNFPIRELCFCSRSEKEVQKFDAAFISNLTKKLIKLQRTWKGCSFLRLAAGQFRGNIGFRFDNSPLPGAGLTGCMFSMLILLEEGPHDW